MATTLYVGNLPFEMTSEKLTKIFSPYGSTSAKMQERQDGRSRGFGLVTFDSETAAKAAVEALNNTDVDGREMYVRVDRHSNPEIMKDGAKLYVGNLPWSMSSSDLKSHFPGCSDAEVVMGWDGRSRGYGLVSFPNVDGLKHALDTKSNMEIDGRFISMRVDREPKAARGREPETKNASGLSVFVGNLSWDTNKTGLMNAFSKFGATEVDVARGWGTVKFKDTAAAEKAIAAMQGKEIDGRPIRVRLDVKA